MFSLTDVCREFVCMLRFLQSCVMNVALTCMNAMLEETFISFYEFVPAAQFFQLVLVC